MDTRIITAGEIYLHYKGNKYVVLHIGKHTENLKEMVVYKAIDNDIIWIRPYDMFNGTVILEDGFEHNRFELVK